MTVTQAWSGGVRLRAEMIIHPETEGPSLRVRATEKRSRREADAGRARCDRALRHEYTTTCHPHVPGSNAWWQETVVAVAAAVVLGVIWLSGRTGRISGRLLLAPLGRSAAQ